MYYLGAGVGGHCLLGDPYYLAKKTKELGFHSKVIAAGRSINDNMPIHMLNLVQDALNENEKSIKNSNIIVLGFSYKENVGDPRESPAKTLTKHLKLKGANVVIVDLYIEKIEPEFGVLNNDLYDALDEADVMVLITSHNDFISIDFKRVKELMNIPIVVDGRRIYDPEELRGMGIFYKGVGAVNLQNNL